MGSIVIPKIPADTYNIFDGDAYVMMVATAAKDDNNLAHVLHSIKMMLNHSREAVPTHHELIYLSAQDKSNFRYDVAKTPVVKTCKKDFVFEGKQIHKGDTYSLDGYKKNRVNATKPKYYQHLRNYLIEYHNAMIVEGIEADDMCGIQATKPNRKATVHTHDKDFMMFEVDVYNLTHKVLHVYDKHWQLEMRGKKLYGRGRVWFYAQMLMGDAGDNIPGIPLYGPVNTFKALQNCNTELDLFKATWEIYKKYMIDDYPPYKGSSEDAIRDAKERYLEIAALLWIQINDLRDICPYLEKHYDFS